MTFKRKHQIALARQSSISPVILSITFSALLTLSWSAHSQDQGWSVERVIAVGSQPQRAVLTPNGRELYVSNHGDNTVSVIDTETGNVTKTIKVGNSPFSMVASHDGSRVYVLVEDAVAIISTADKSIRDVQVPGRTDEMALTQDDSKLYLTRVYDGVFFIDTATYKLSPPIINTLCPIGMALSKDERLLYVSYQCEGPGGTVAHDAVGVYRLPSYEPLAVIRGLANVGGQLALSPDGKQVWIQGLDACSRPDYPHGGCPSEPSRVVNVLQTTDIESLNRFQDFDCANPADPCPLLKTFGFSLEDANGRMSFSPDGEAFVGDGVSLKEIKTSEVSGASAANITKLPIADVGQIAFQPDGKRAYLTLIDKNAVAVVDLKTTVGDNAASASARKFVTSITPQTAASVLSINSNCAHDDSGLCYRVVPSDFARDVLNVRGFTGDTGDPPGPTDDAYCATAERIIDTDPWTALQLMDARTIQEYLEYNTPATAGTSTEEMRDVDAQEIGDVTQRLISTPSIQGYLDDSSVALYTVVCKNSYHTVLIRRTGQPEVWPSKSSKVTPIDQSTLEAAVNRLRDELSDGVENDSCRDSGQIQADSNAVYKILLGDPSDSQSLSAKLKAEAGITTLVWVLHDTLRYLPMDALYDGQRYLVQGYSSAVLLRSPAKHRAPSMALVAGLPEAFKEKEAELKSNGEDVSLDMAGDLRKIFADAGSADTSRIPADFLFDSAFTPDSLSHELEAPESGGYPIIHIASDFVLDHKKADDSFLTTWDSSDGRPDGKLFIPALRKYRFNTGLLTLEACSSLVDPSNRTAEYGDGREREDFGYIAMQNGADAVVASLWEVDYLSTMKLMKIFYQDLKNGMSRSTALRDAELALMQGRPEGSPDPTPAGCRLAARPSTRAHMNIRISGRLLC